MRHIILSLILCLFTSFAVSATPCSNMVFGGVFPTTSEPVKIICKKRYVIGYSTTRKAPLWVAEKLTAAQVRAAVNSRTGSFSIDSSISKNEQSTLKEFIGSGFDRGHMVPYEDLADDPIASAETNMLTNVVPQAALNNRGIWNALEKRARALAVSRGEVFIITGPIYDGKVSTLSGGTPIPTRLWKIILVPHTTESFTVIIPNANGLPTSTMPTYFSSISSLRKINSLVNPLPARSTFNDKRSFN